MWNMLLDSINGLTPPEGLGKSSNPGLAAFIIILSFVFLMIIIISIIKTPKNKNDKNNDKE